MKNLPLRDERVRFRGHLRHYHRSATQIPRTWNDWIDGAPTNSASSVNWMKVVPIVMAILALGGIAVGLFIELR